MKVITEKKVDELIKSGVSTVNINKNTIITSLALEKLKLNKIKIIKKETKKPAEGKFQVNQNIDEEKIDEIKKNNPVYIDYKTGKNYREKPEHLTSIKKNRLVSKTHEIIIFRGKIDVFIALLLEYMEEINNTSKELIDDYKTILLGVRSLQYAEVSGTPLLDPNFLCLSYGELKDHSHHPKKYYNLEHLFNLDYMANKTTLKANLLRALSREVELAGVKAFVKENKVKREDILIFLNRLSSALYIIEIKSETGRYR